MLVVVTPGFGIIPYSSAQGDTLHAVDFFRGFGHEALLAVAALVIAGQSLVRTGALEPIGRGLARDDISGSQQSRGRRSRLEAGSPAAHSNNSPNS